MAPANTSSIAHKPHATFVAVAFQASAPALDCRRFTGRALLRLPPEAQWQSRIPGVMGCGTGCWSLPALYRKATLGCKSCGDCLQDHLDYAGCSMRWCYKELRNGPCGGSRVDGTCEARPEQPCIWNVIYRGALAMGDDPRKVRPHPDPAARLVPGRHQRPGQSLGGDG